MFEGKYNVLFLCTGNSARSILAEAALNRDGQGLFRGYSAGSHPTGKIHPFALDTLKLGHYATADLRSKDWAEFAKPDAPQLDFVFTVCDQAAQEVCPVWPGQPMSAHWGLPDPAKFKGSDTETRAVFSETLRMLTNRISIFVSLPIASLNRLSLQKELDQIGETNRPTEDIRP